jgi:hypothetical protein
MSDDISARFVKPLRLAIFLGGGLAAANTPVNAEVKPHAIEFWLAVNLLSWGRYVWLGAGNLREAITVILVANRSSCEKSGWCGGSNIAGNSVTGRVGKSLTDAPGVGGGFAATRSPVQAKVEALGADFRIGEGLVFSIDNAGKCDCANED